MSKKAPAQCKDCAHMGRKTPATAVATYWTWNNDGDARHVCDAHSALNATLWKGLSRDRIGNPARHTFDEATHA